MNDEQIKYMVNRFLGWKLPENFNPDGGISFKKIRNEHTPYAAKNEPTGTNLLDAIQAEEMIRYIGEIDFDYNSLIPPQGELLNALSLEDEVNNLRAENESLKAELHKPRRIECAYCSWKTEPMTEENNRWEEMRQHITTCEKRFSANGYEMYKAAIARAEKAEAERDQALEVVREYRKNTRNVGRNHNYCRTSVRYPGLGIKDDRCPTCIKADELLSRETKEEK